MYILHETTAGSRLYGTNRPDSDYDVRGIFVAPKIQVVGLTSLQDRVAYTENNRDIEYLELRKFLHLALNNNPNILDTLCAPAHFWTNINPLWLKIYAQRHRFFTTRIRQTFTGYAISQLEHLKRKGNPYDVKHAMHVFRLLQKAKTILDMVYYDPVLTHDELQVAQRILAGEFTLDTILAEAETLRAEVDTMTTHLPADNSAFASELNSLVIEIYETAWAA